MERTRDGANQQRKTRSLLFLWSNFQNSARGLLERLPDISVGEAGASNRYPYSPRCAGAVGIGDRVVGAGEKKAVPFVAGEGFSLVGSIADQFAVELQIPNRQLAGVSERD